MNNIDATIYNLTERICKAANLEVHTDTELFDPPLVALRINREKVSEIIKEELLKHKNIIE